MAKHTIEAHFVVSSGAVKANAEQELEDRVVMAMAQAMAGGGDSAFNLIKYERDARMIYRAVNAMREALAKE